MRKSGESRDERDPNQSVAASAAASSAMLAMISRGLSRNGRRPDDGLCVRAGGVAGGEGRGAGIYWISVKRASPVGTPCSQGQNRNQFTRGRVRARTRT